MSFRDRPSGNVESGSAVVSALARAVVKLQRFSERWSARYVEMRVDALKDS